MSIVFSVLALSISVFCLVFNTVMFNRKNTVHKTARNRNKNRGLKKVYSKSTEKAMEAINSYRMPGIYPVNINNERDII